MSTAPAPNPSTSEPQIDVVTVTYNSRRHIDALIASVRASEGVEVRLTIVDNASSDGTADYLRRTYPEIDLIAQTRNAGFGAGVNVGVHATAAPIVALVNPDVVLAPATLRALASVVTSHHDVGVVGPQQWFPDGSWQRSSGSVPGMSEAITRLLGVAKAQDRLTEQRSRRGDRRKLLDVGYVDGAVMVMRRSVFEDVGGFDEDFFLYAEEADLCARINDHGLRIVLDQRADAMHVRGGSWAPDPAERVRRTLQIQRAKYQLVRKRSKGRVVPWCYSFVWMLHSTNRGLIARIGTRNGGGTDDADDSRIALSAAESVYWRSNLSHRPVPSPRRGNRIRWHGR